MKPVVLFVDDEPHVLSGLRRSLRSKREDWDMRFVEGGAAALDVLSKHAVDVIVSDMRMPDVDGADVMERSQQHAPHAVRYILSGEADRASTCRTIGSSHRFLAKPCPTDVLIDAIEGPLRWRRDAPDGFGRWRVEHMPHLARLDGVLDGIEAALAVSDPDPVAIAALIERDPSLTLRLLQLVNSAYFRPGRPTTRALDALNRLGPPTLQELVAERRFGGVEQVAPEIAMCVTEPSALDLAIAAHDRALADNGDQEIADAAHAVGLLMRLGGQFRCGGASPPRSMHTPIAGYVSALLGLPAVVTRALSKLAPMAVLPSLEASAAAVSAAVSAARMGEQAVAP